MLVVFAVVVCLSVRASTCHGYSGWTKNGATIWLPISSKRPGGATRFYKFVQYIVNRCSQNKTTLTFAKNHANCPCVLKIWTVKHNSPVFLAYHVHVSRRQNTFCSEVNRCTCVFTLHWHCSGSSSSSVQLLHSPQRLLWTFLGYYGPVFVSFVITH